ncbi:MAG: enolase C-terminal domain-like protein [Pseudomonadales bacterium]
MNIRDIEARALDIPFRLHFKHHRADRTRTQALLVRTRTQNECIGFGEGCPREYVTNETLTGCLGFVEHHASDLAETIHSTKDLEAWIDQHEHSIDTNPAAWCAIELSLLDAISKDLGQSIETTLGTPPLSGTFQYTAVLGDNSPSAFGQLVAQYVGLGFDDFKVKITGEVQNDNEKLSLVVDAAPDARIRLDANNIWGTTEEVLTYLHSLSVAPFALEEPLQPRAFSELNRLLQTTSVPIILDESFLKLSHFDPIDTSHNNVIINIRISKMGGLMRARSIARLLSVAGVPLIIGAQVGETSLLTRAGLCLANEFKECVIAQEGAFGTLLLETDVTNESLMFGSKGRLKCPGTGQDVAAHGFELRYKSDLFGSDASDS